MSRRKFMFTSLAATAALATRVSFAQGSQPKPAGMKVGLYSITFLGIWFRGKAMPLDEMIKWAKGHGFEGVEIDGKRPHGNPVDWPTKRCKELRSIADNTGIDIYGVAANNDLSSPMPEFREAQIAYVRDLIRMTADLGGKTLRMFLGWPGVTKHPQLAKYEIARDIWKYTHEKFSKEEIWGWCREGLAECTKYAENAGITLALQNHAPVIEDYPDVIKMVRDINSPNLKISLDVWALLDKSPEGIQKAARAVGNLQVLSHFGDDINDRDASGKVTGADYYPHFIKAMHDIGFSGYLGYELCHPLPVVNGQTVGIEYAGKKAEEAAEFMKGLIAEASKG
ncbi:MAG: sugar phosphate isomerase/epimerase family protein [Bacteroidota bacterium]|nr:sugar phosphate isomerase/epimerase family protein [Bacteroidota bacterium]